MATNSINPHITFCINNKILVYPVLSDKTKGKFKIEASVKGKKKLFSKEITSPEINNAMDKTYKYYYDKYK